MLQYDMADIWQQSKTSVIPDCVSFVGVFTKLRRANSSFVVSVRMEQFGPHWSDFHEMRCQYFSKICRENTTTVSTTRHVQQLRSNGWTCRVVRLLPHTKACEHSLYKTLLMMER